MSVAQVVCLDNARSRFQEKKLQQNYLDYLKMLTDEEIENEVNFFLEHHAHQLKSNPKLANRGYCLMQELAQRIECDMMKSKVREMAEGLKAQLEY